MSAETDSFQIRQENVAFCYFKPALFFQQVQNWHIADSGLEFKMDISTGINQARFMTDGIDLELWPADRKNQAIETAEKIVSDAQGRGDSAALSRRLFESSTWGDHESLQYLLRSCYVTEETAVPAFTEACHKGFCTCVAVFLKAGMSPTKRIQESTGKNAFHIACQNGHEECAMLLLEAMESREDALLLTDSGETGFQLLRNNDMCGIARRLDNILVTKFDSL